MKKRMNENGYALVTVLLIITVFIILFLSFTGQSFSTVKQNEMIEKKSQSIALAEMGITYFQRSVENIYYGVIENYENKSQEYMFDELKSLENLVGKEFEIEKDSASFSFKSKDGDIVHESGDEIIIEFVSIGSATGEIENEEKTEKIGAKITIDFSDSITEDQSGKSNRPPLPENLPNSDSITEPTDLSNCGSILNFSNQDCVINGGKTFDQNTNDVKFNNSTVKVNGDLKIYGNMNNDIIESTIYVENEIYFKRQVKFNNTELYVGGIPDFDETVYFSNGSSIFFGEDANFKFNFNISNSDLYAEKDVFFKKPTIINNQSNIYINGFADFEETVNISKSNVYFNRADFKKNFTLDNSHIRIESNTNFKETVDIKNNSTMYISGESYFKKNFKLSNSTMFIDGNAKFDDTVDISNGSTLCVNGFFDIKHNKNINNNGSIFAKTSNNDKVNTNITEFEDNCKFDNSNDGTSDWTNPKIISNLEYNY